MNESMKNRRSIRKYQDAPVSRELLEEVLRAGNLAPSAKNRQPWRFVVATGRGKAEAVAAMRRGLAREAETPLLPGGASRGKRKPRYFPAARNTGRAPPIRRRSWSRPRR